MFVLNIQNVSTSLEVVNVQGVERMSTPFEFVLEILTGDSSLTRRIGENATLRIQRGRNRTTRHGVINQISMISAEGAKIRYQVTLVPSLAQLDLRSDSRIFQDLTIEEVLATVLQEHGINDFQFSFTNSPIAKDYMVQYRETNLEFLHRIVEGEGLYYYFEHRADGHRLIFADNVMAYKPLSSRSQTLRFNSATGATENVQELRLSSLAVSDAVRLRDYNYENPTSNLDVSKNTSPSGASFFEVYDFPGGYKTRTAGRQQARFRFEAERLDAFFADAVTNSLRLAPGYTYQLVGHPVRTANRAYVVTELIHKGEQNPANRGQFQYQNNMVCISAKTVYRLTDGYPALIMQGPQTATVVGPAGEETFVDEHGRVKVQFHWDRHGQSDESSSAWIRVAQNSAGNGWGHMVIPRIGSEVLIDFVNGDPHRPVIIGSLYNGTNHPPYALPANKNITAIKTRSTPNSRGFNELVFDDTAGRERVFLRSQKDLSVIVLNSQEENIAGNSMASINGDAELAIGGQRTETVASDMSRSIGGEKSENIGSNLNLEIGNSLSEEVGGDRTLTVGSNQSCSVGKDLTQAIGKNYTCSVDDKTTLNAKSITLDAVDTLTLKVGSAKIVMKKNGDIKIEGNKIDIKANGKLTMTGSNL